MQRSKQGRTIILTTHAMEEAELLADRVGIMNNGVLRGCVTHIFFVIIP
jgi:ABC-type multidrug transport system ATPase subunit